MIIFFHLTTCPYCRKVREKLGKLNIKYIAVDIADEEKSNLLEKIGGKIQVPFIIDLETGKMMYESDDINKYLEEKYRG